MRALLLALGLLTGCGTAPDAPPSAAFDPATLRPGDRFLGLDVLSVDAHRAAVDGDWTGAAAFAGEVEVAGTYRPHPAFPDVQAPCFFVESGAERLPRFPADERRRWFCFTNAAEAEDALGPVGTERKATVVIDTFRSVFAPSDVNDEAHLARVVSGG